MRSPRVIVLGAKGFVAGSLIRLLESEGQPCRPVGSHEVDLTDPIAIPRLGAIFRPEDAVVVCSAITPEKGRDRATFLKNVRMVDHLCAALADAPCAQVVYISSDSVYGSRPSHGLSLNEDSCCETGDLYGLSHIVREKMLCAACTALGIPLAILRPSAIYGADDTHNAYGPNRFVRTALACGRITLFGEGEEVRDHIYIRDIARIIRLSLENRTAATLNAVAGVSLSFRDIAHAINQALGGAIGIEPVPRQVPVIHRRFDVTALRTAFPGFHPTEFNIAIREMIDALQA